MAREINGQLILENEWVRIGISAENAKVQQITEKATGENIRAEVTAFFALVAQDKETEILPEKLTVSGDVITVDTALGSIRVKVEEHENWFAFELLTALPKGAYKARLAHAKYEYDPQNAKACRAVGVALTYWTNPCFYPDGKAKETMAEVTAHLKDVGARYALIVAPHDGHRRILKEVCLTIDPRYGIVNPNGGPWGRESRLNRGNSIIVYNAAEDFVAERIPFYQTLGVDQIDFHKGKDTFRQGDFQYDHYTCDAEFKEKIADLLEKNGMTAGLHTYSSYIDYNCSGIMADPKWHKDLGVLETFTLSEDVTAESEFLPTVEATDEVSGDHGFFSRNTPYILVGQEIIEFENASGGFRVKQRGAIGTTAAAHKKGETVRHLEGYYHGFAPVLGSELFFEIARNTAKTFCAGGFKTIYLDALDGITRHCDRKNEAWYYMAAFVTELIANCDYPPMLEYSTIFPSIWAGRGRFGAWDTPSRGYKEWNRMHMEENKLHLDRLGTATMGWYNFYPHVEKYPGNVHTKYQHTDAVHHLGSLSLMYDFNVVFNDIEREDAQRLPALARNIAIYKQYDTLRKAQYFEETLLETARGGKYEYHLNKASDGKFSLVEKKFQLRKFYDLASEERNAEDFENPFEEQAPFVRVEALLSSGQTEEETLLELRGERTLQEQTVSRKLDSELDLSGKLANHVSICGNGKPGSAVEICMTCGTLGEPGLLKFFVDTDYVGWRDFVLVESDNGQRTDLPFDDCSGREMLYMYQIHRSQFHHDRVNGISVRTTKEGEGVKMTSITACRHRFTQLENPSVQIGDSKVIFHTALNSTDFIEFDGKRAKVIDRYGNEREIAFTGSLTAPAGSFTAKVRTENREACPLRAQLTLGFTGGQIG